MATIRPGWGRANGCKVQSGLACGSFLANLARSGPLCLHIRRARPRIRWGQGPKRPRGPHSNDARYHERSGPPRVPQRKRPGRPGRGCACKYAFLTPRVDRRALAPPARGWVPPVPLSYLMLRMGPSIVKGKQLHSGLRNCFLYMI